VAKKDEKPRWEPSAAKFGPRPSSSAPHHCGVPEIVPPEPSLVVMVGAAGAGKSTIAARHFAPDEVLSADAFRRIVSGEEANPAATKAAFVVLHDALERRLANGRTTLVDATCIEPRARRELVARAAMYGNPYLRHRPRPASDDDHRAERGASRSRRGHSGRASTIETPPRLVRRPGSPAVARGIFPGRGPA
jgi:hypothetical protein